MVEQFTALFWALAEPLLILLVMGFFFRMFLGVLETGRYRWRRRPGSGPSPLGAVLGWAVRLAGALLAWVFERLVIPALTALGRGVAYGWKAAVNRSARQAPERRSPVGADTYHPPDDPDGLEELWRRS